MTNESPRIAKMLMQLGSIYYNHHLVNLICIDNKFAGGFCLSFISLKNSQKLGLKSNCDRLLSNSV